jgi:hypothetical protein
MNRVDLHPEQLFDRLRAGLLRPAEFALLKAHCVQCVACRLELQMSIDGMHADTPDASDAALGAAVVDRMFPRSATPTPRLRRAPRWRAAAFVSAGVVFGGTMTAAAMLGQVPHGPIVRAIATLLGTSEPSISAADKARPALPQLTPPLPSTSPPASVDPPPLALPRSTDEARSEPDPARSTARLRANEGGPDSGRPSGRQAARDGRSEAERLLAAATRARVQGRFAEAADLYRSVRRHYPGTEAAVVGRGSPAPPLFFELGRPDFALDLFAEYLDERPHGALGPEARNGRAACLERLGRSDEAREAWQELIAHHPSSLYAQEARARSRGP